MREFDLIGVIRRRAATRADVLLGIGDDGAILRVPPDHDLIVVTDTLNAGIHFPATTAPADIGWKALAVNLSDLAAMGAQPAWCTLALSLPESGEAWIEQFLDGFFKLAKRHDCALVGGDTTRGPLSICVTAHGFVPHGRALRRDGAQPGDEIWITGTLGDAAAALAQWRAKGDVDARLRERLDRPTPRIETGLALRGLATACIDISDGLAADLGHLLTASCNGATLDIDALPASSALRDAFDTKSIQDFQLGGGDDYELCFTAPASARDALTALNLDATCIGRIESAPGLRLRDADGNTRDSTATGWDHFR